MSAVPIRVRVTLVLAVAIALVLLGAGLFVYTRLGAELDESIDQGLRSRAAELSTVAGLGDGGLGRRGSSLRGDSEESFAQLLAPGGRVVDSTPQLGDRPALDRAELDRAAAEPTFLERDALPGVEGAVRIRAAPVEGAGGELIAVVGSSLEDRDEALASLARLLLVGGPVALVLASLAGYLAVGAALRPVEAMRRRAAAISAAEPGERLPLPAATDELWQLGRTLNEMLARLEAAIERERRFVDDASHELRTPLTLHKTELELAARHGATAGELRAAIGSAIEEVDRLIQLAEDLLVVARSEKGELALDREALAVDELLAAVTDRFRARAAEARRPIVTDGAGLAVTGDRLRLEQALTNLVDNALRYGDGEVRLWARANGGRVELHVTDQGPGFPHGFADRAFERFSRADAARSRGGVGLGLAIVDAIARAHGGRAGAAGDGGVDVWVELPIAP